MIAQMPVIWHIPMIFLQPLLEDVAALAMWAPAREPLANRRKHLLLQYPKRRLKEEVQRVIDDSPDPQDHFIQWRKRQGQQQEEHRDNDLRVVLVELEFPLQKLHFHGWR